MDLSSRSQRSRGRAGSENRRLPPSHASPSRDLEVAANGDIPPPGPPHPLEAHEAARVGKAGTTSSSLRGVARPLTHRLLRSVSPMDNEAGGAKGGRRDAERP